MSRVVVITHNDLDGEGCKFLAEYSFSDVKVNAVDNYSVDKTIMNVLGKSKYENSILYITDVAPEQEETIVALDEAFKKGREIYLIDHHATAMYLNQYEWANVKSEYEDGRKTAATSLFFEHLEKENAIQTSFVSSFVELVRLYDTWEWEKENNLEAKKLNDLFYILGMKDFNERLLKKSSDECNSFMFDEVEEEILKLEQKRIESTIKSKSKKIVQREIGDLVYGVVFSEVYISELGNELAKQYPHLDAIAIVHMSNKKISVRTIHEHVNLSLVAKGYGGGGHPKASGFPLNGETKKSFVDDVFDSTPIQPDADNKYNVKDTNVETYYRNVDEEIYTIIKKETVGGHIYNVVFDFHELVTEFSTFIEAENFLKCNYQVSLMEDDLYIECVARKLRVNPDHLRSHYHEYVV